MIVYYPNMTHDTPPVDTPIEAVNFMVVCCCACGRVASGDRKWFKAEDLMSIIPRSRVSHTICPECLPKLYPDTHRRLILEGKVAS